jgi:LysM repeat protein
MKSLKPIILTVITAVTLSTGSMTMAETASTVSGDGFLELNVVEVGTGEATKQAVKQTPKASVRAKRATRTERQKRTTRKTYASSYRVRSGDTLTKIAAKFQVSVDRLARLNNLRGAKKNHIEVGQRLRLR